MIQDIDDRIGYGAYWGEVQSTIHKALGSIGCVTNGSFRDLDMWAPGFQMIGGRIGPSHAHVHMVDFGKPVNIFGMQAAHDDVIHADFHGAVVIPADAVRKLPAAIDLVSRREKVILDVCRAPGFHPGQAARRAEAVGRDPLIMAHGPGRLCPAFATGRSHSGLEKKENPLYTEIVQWRDDHGGDPTDCRHPSSAGR